MAAPLGPGSRRPRPPIRRTPKCQLAEPQSYLADSIRKDYAAPEGFESRARRAAREAAERGRRRQEAGARRRRQAERARERALEAGVAKSRDGLSPEGRRALDAAALDRADAGLAETCRGMEAGGNPLAASFLGLLRNPRTSPGCWTSPPRPGDEAGGPRMRRFRATARPGGRDVR